MPLLPTLALALSLGLAAAARAQAPTATPAPAPASAAVAPAAVPGVRCDDPAPPEAPAVRPTPQAARAWLRTLVQGAIERSAGAGAARLAAEAAQDDLREAEAARRLQASLSATAGPAVSSSGDLTQTAALQWRGGVALSQILWDGGRSERIVEMRRLQGEAARLAQLGVQEQVALATIGAAYDVSRYAEQAQVYQDYQRSARCLVRSLEQVVAADRGRASELVQARKSLAQVVLAQTQAEAAARQARVRLQRYAGDAPVDTAALQALLTEPPGLPALLAEAERASDIAQLQAQAGAAGALAQSAQAALRPQLSLTAGLNQASSVGGSLPTSHGANANVGLALSIPLLDSGARSAADAAARRAQSAQLQRDDALDARRNRIADLHDQVDSAFDRARQTEAVLADSARLREYTLLQWQQLGRRSLFDVMAAESEHYGLRIAAVNARHDGQQLNAMLRSLGAGLLAWIEVGPAR